MHPIDIIQEIKDFPFFKDFDADLLAQISIMLAKTTYEPGDIVIAEGKPNHFLFFLVSGEVEVLVDGERINFVRTPGEVLGEMSVLSLSPASATVRARAASVFYKVNSDDLDKVVPEKKDRFLYLIYRLHSKVLTQRLIQTNEKAKLFERTARELERANHDLETIAQTQMNMLLKAAEKSTNRKRVAFIDPVKKNHMLAKNTLGSSGLVLFIFENLATLEIKTIETLDIIICDLGLHQELLAIMNLCKKQVPIVWMAPMDFKEQNYWNRMDQFDFLIMRNEENRSEVTRSYLRCVSNVMEKDIFGLNHFLSPHTQLTNKDIQESGARAGLIEEMTEYFKDAGIRQSVIGNCQIVAEELLMNAIYDAPVDSNKKPLYNHLPRTIPVNLDFAQKCSLHYGTDGLYLGIAVRDPFGSLKLPIIGKYLDSCYSGRAGELNQNNPEKGGAGRGLHQIIENSHITNFNIKPGTSTEIVCLWDLDAIQQKKDVKPTFNVFHLKD